VSRIIGVIPRSSYDYKTSTTDARRDIFLTSMSLSSQERIEETDIDEKNVTDVEITTDIESTAEEAVEQERVPLEEIVVTAKRRSLINLGDLFASEPEPDFVEPDAMRVESERLPGRKRLERFIKGDKMYCFEVREANPMDSFDNGNVFQRRY
jgi:hypothetical protein